MNGRRILLVEDESDIAHLVTLHLAQAGATVVHAHDGTSGLSEALTSTWDLVLLDLGLPGCDGLDVCRRLREHRPSTPIIMLTARSSEAERVTGLQCGADDYVVKPFGVRELIARIDALLRRVDALAQTPQDGIVSSGEISLDRGTHTARVAGVDVQLTAREFDLLAHFVRHPGCVFSRSDLLTDVWGQTYDGYLHTVNTHINRLRRKIERDTGNPRFIQTVWGVGYRLRSVDGPG